MMESAKWMLIGALAYGAACGLLLLLVRLTTAWLDWRRACWERREARRLMTQRPWPWRKM